jgi:hypothetical protein
MTSIFVSYRRDDVPDEARELLARLSQSISFASVFSDLDSLPLGIGQDWSSTIEQRISVSEALVVVIGPDWLTAGDWRDRRLEDRTDFVRLEIESALRRNKRVVPVLVNGAEMPRAECLSEEFLNHMNHV